MRVLLALVEAVGLLTGLDGGVALGALYNVSPVDLTCIAIGFGIRIVPGHQPRRCCGIRRWKTCLCSCGWLVVVVKWLL